MLPWLAVSLAVCAGVPRRVVEEIDWATFLARQDLVWEQVPVAWHEGAFVGNGLLGAMVYRDGPTALRFDLGRSDIRDYPPTGAHRLPVGELLLRFNGTITGGQWRLDLWQAEARGSVVTDRGRVEFRCFTHALDPVIIIELTTSGGEADCRWEFRPGISASPRQVYRKEALTTLNPEGRLDEVDGGHVFTQPRRAGGDYATAWREIRQPDGRRTLYVSLADSYPEPGAREVAWAAVARAIGRPPGELVASHRRWWSEFYPRSFLSLPDPRLESFYWIQLYKLASATRADRPAIDLMGPWFRTTPWPMIWWNLNLQLTYWPVYAANHLELGESLTRMLDAGVENLIQNVRPEWRADSAAIGRTSSYDCRGGVGDEVGNLTWTLHNYWWQYRHGGDEDLLHERLYPLLKRAVGYYLHLLTEGPDGRLHLPVHTSPEYPVKAADTNYDLSLLRWGLQTLLWTTDRLQLNDPLAARWREVLAKLVPYPVDETGLMIGAGVPLAQSHRHFSHLLMIYPLALLTGEEPAERALIERSLNHWIGFEGALQGYSFTGAAAIAARLGERERPVKFLHEFIRRYVKPNTMYLEAGPVIETPLSGARAIQELVLQSWGDTIRVFPAVPDSWPEVVVHKFLAEGAFEVSARRAGGRTVWVAVKSLAGEPCRLAGELPEPLVVGGDRAFTLRREGATVTLDLRRGETVILTDGQSPVTVAPVAVDEGLTNPFGTLKKPPVRATADGQLDLWADTAELHGTDLFWQKVGDEQSLGHWVNGSDWVSWKIIVDRPGVYRVKVHQASPGGGLRYRVAVGEASLEGRVERTGDWQKFQAVELGRLTLPAGAQRLEVRAVEFPGGALMNLQRVELLRSDE